jgi:hypothetical protein
MYRTLALSLALSTLLLISRADQKTLRFSSGIKLDHECYLRCNFLCEDTIRYAVAQMQGFDISATKTVVVKKISTDVSEAYVYTEILLDDSENAHDVYTDAVRNLEESDVLSTLMAVESDRNVDNTFRRDSTHIQDASSEWESHYYVNGECQGCSNNTELYWIIGLVLGLVILIGAATYFYMKREKPVEVIDVWTTILNNPEGYVLTEKDEPEDDDDESVRESNASTVIEFADIGSTNAKTALV